MASRAALAQGFQEHQARACASSSFSLSDMPEMASRLMRAPSHGRARAISHSMSPSYGALSVMVPVGTARAQRNGLFCARARARCGGGCVGTSSSSAERRNACSPFACRCEPCQHRGITSGGRAGHASDRARARARAMKPNSRLFGLVGRGGCDGPLSPPRTRPIRTLTTVLVRRGAHVRCVWRYGVYCATRHGSRGSLSAGAVWSLGVCFL